MKTNLSNLTKLKPADIKIGLDVVIIIGVNVTKVRIVTISERDWTKDSETLKAANTKIIEDYKAMAKNGLIYVTKK